jgi:polyferredoxin
MNEALEFAVYSLVIGTGATVLIDLWALGLKWLLGIPSMNWGLVGRWIGHMPAGRFVHDGIGKATPITGEMAIGWIAHYAIGVVFAGILLAMWGLDWAHAPTLLPALIIGWATIVAPFFLMQPGLGLGIAAARAPKPGVARLRSFLTHTVFGLGLYGSAYLLALARPLA